MIYIKALNLHTPHFGKMLGTNYQSKILSAIAVCAVMVWIFENPTKAAEPPDWSVALSEEIWFEHACRVAFFSQIIERDTKAGRILMVKVHCEDQRSFDASQSGLDAPFIFSECKPREQNAC